MNNKVIEGFPYFVGKLPFVYKNLLTPNNTDEIPNSVDFSLDVDLSTGLLIQKFNTETEQLLKKAYDSGSQITGYMDNYDFGAKYANDFIEFILKREIDINNSKILEIGCGTGYLLNQLKLMGADVVGIEPGMQAEVGRKKYGVNIVSDFYPTELIKEDFDIIIFYNVLEHITDYELFLINVQKQLKDNGRLYFAVPDCEKAIESGDVSMLIHEHFNYFTEKSLKNVFIKSIQNSPVVEKSKFSSELNGSMVNRKELQQPPFSLSTLIESNTAYLVKMRNLNDHIVKFLINANENNKTVGIYVPSRIINILSLMEYELNYDLIEFYDDNPELESRFFPGFNRIIKKKSDLIQNPKDYILIMSYSFSDQIKNNLIEVLSSETTIIKYQDLI